MVGNGTSVVASARLVVFEALPQVRLMVCSSTSGPHAKSLDWRGQVSLGSVTRVQCVSYEYMVSVSFLMRSRHLLENAVPVRSLAVFLPRANLQRLQIRLELRNHGLLRGRLLSRPQQMHLQTDPEQASR